MQKQVWLKQGESSQVSKVEALPGCFLPHRDTNLTDKKRKDGEPQLFGHLLNPISNTRKADEKEVM